MVMLFDGRVPGTALPVRPLRARGAPDRCRTNSRRGLTDDTQRSYPPVEAVRRAFDVLRAVNRLRIASVNCIHNETRMPKSTIVRMLETLMAEGYVARDNMCGGYSWLAEASPVNAISSLFASMRAWPRSRSLRAISFSFFESTGPARLEYAESLVAPAAVKVQRNETHSL